MSKPKQILNPKSQRWFKSTKTETQPHIKVDAEKGIIYDVVLAQSGPAKGHNTICEMPFISKIVDEGMKRTAGIKVHFGHPSMSEQTLGTFTGRAFNHRLKGDQALADIHLSQTAINSPKGDLYSYLLDLAAKEPDQFGMSVVTVGNQYWEKNPETNEYELLEFDDWGSPIFKYTEELVYETFEELNAVDFVDEGALTPNGLFSIEFNRDKFAVGITEFLDNHPEMDAFVKSNPEKLAEFMSKRYGKSFSIKEQKSLFQTIRDIFSDNKSSTIIKKYMNEFDINATTADGLAITIISASQDTPAVGDAVVDSSTGDPVPDGDHVIANDSPALAGDTITVTGGVIEAVTPMAADPNPTPTPPAPMGTETVESLKAALVAEKKKSASLNAQLKRAGAGEFTPVFNGGHNPGSKAEVLSDNQKAARAAQEEAKKRYSKNKN